MERGFTLIELLVVIAIIGILASIAVPQFQDYRKRGFDVRAETDLRNVATAEEAYFLDHEEYLACQNDDCTELPGIRALSKGVELNITLNDTGYIGHSHHLQGTGRIFVWDSERGGMVEE